MHSDASSPRSGASDRLAIGPVPVVGSGVCAEAMCHGVWPQEDNLRHCQGC